jgi:hypothetical protein
MNPKDFPWEADQQVTVTNPTGKPYEFKVHNKDYALGAGETAKMPGYIAWVYVYGLASLLCQEAKEFNRWNEEGFKQTYFEKVVIGADDVIEKIVVEPTVEVETVETGTEDEESEEEEVAEDADTSAPTQLARRTRHGRSGRS